MLNTGICTESEYEDKGTLQLSINQWERPQQMILPTPRFWISDCKILRQDIRVVYPWLINAYIYSRIFLFFVLGARCSYIRVSCSADHSCSSIPRHQVERNRTWGPEFKLPDSTLKFDMEASILNSSILIEWGETETQEPSILQSEVIQSHKSPRAGVLAYTVENNKSLPQTKWQVQMKPLNSLLFFTHVSWNRYVWTYPSPHFLFPSISLNKKREKSLQNLPMVSHTSRNNHSSLQTLLCSISFAK